MEPLPLTVFNTVLMEETGPIQLLEVSLLRARVLRIMDLFGSLLATMVVRQVAFNSVVMVETGPMLFLVDLAAVAMVLLTMDLFGLL